MMNNDDSLNFDITPEDIQYYKDVKRKRIIGIVFKVLIYILLSFWAFIAIFPIVWTLSSSFKVMREIVTQPFSLPFGDSFSLEGYRKVFTGKINIVTGYLNSFYISGLVVVLTVLSAILVAFVMARYKFKFKQVVYSVIVACMMFPAFSLLFPIIRILNTLDLFDTQLGVVFPQVALNLGFTVILLIGFFQGLPLEVEESAFMDGASVFRVLFQIMVPMAKSAIVTCMIFVFVWSYNDLFLQLMIISTPSKFPISLLLNEISTSQAIGYEYDKMAAASTLVCIPIIIVYCILQRHIIKGLTAGAVKG